MKIFNKILISAFTITLAVACNDGIDPISSVPPGPDETAPTIKLNFPFEGAELRVREDVAPINIQFEATDDIDIKSVILTLDGTQIGEIGDFKDYRKAISVYKHDGVTNGSHTLSAVVTDVSGKSSSTSVTFEKVPPYQPKYSGEIFYMPFDGDYFEQVVIKEATKVGVLGFADIAKVGKSLAGAPNAYVTIPTAGYLSTELSATFWYKVNASPDRAGILVAGPPDPNPEAPGKPNNRKNGFRFFREGGATNQNFILNVGNGEADEWINGGPALTLDPTTAGWVHMAFTLSENEAVIYFNGQVVKQAPFGGIDWSGADILSIGSGAPRFMGWDHLSDQSNIDELRLFNKVLTQTEIQAVMNGN
jgi:hypothetical protein